MTKRLLMIVASAGFGLTPLFAATPALAFHHVALPTECAATAAGANAGNNPTAKAAIMEHNPAQTLPLPPFGTPSRADEAPAPEHCTNA
jgi:hypothetical protein